MSGTDKQLRVLQQQGWLAGCPRQLQEKMLAAGRLTLFDPEDYAFHRGDQPGGVHGVVHGGFKIYIRLVTGELRLVHILREGMWFGEGPFVSGGQRQTEAKALDASATLYFPLQTLEALMNQEVDLAGQFARLAFQNLQVSIDIVSALAGRRADQRIASVLLRCSGADLNSSEFKPDPLRVTQAEIGEMANASRHVANKVLQDMESRGWIDCGYQQVTIRSVCALQDYLRSAV